MTVGVAWGLMDRLTDPHEETSEACGTTLGGLSGDGVVPSIRGDDRHLDCLTTFRHITVMSNDRHGVSNYRFIECLFNSLLRLTTKTHEKPALLSLCVESTGDSPHKATVTRKMLPFDDVIMNKALQSWSPYFNSLRRHMTSGSWPTAVLVITCSLAAPSPNLNHSWLIFNWIPGNIFKWNINQNTMGFIKKHPKISSAKWPPFCPGLDVLTMVKERY